VYIDHVTYFNGTITVTNPKEHIVLYVFRAPGPDCSGLPTDKYTFKKY
jgi:hypothetical protein